MNVYVHEFSIGFGPALFSWGKNETKYFLRLLPLGGYVIGASKLSKDIFENTDVPQRSLDRCNLNFIRNYFLFLQESE